MTIFPSGDSLSMVLFAVLLLSIAGLASFVVIKLGAPRRTITHRGLRIRANLGLPAGKIVLVDENWRPIGETSPDLFDMLSLPEGAVAAWLSSADFAELEARKTSALRPLVRQPMRPDVGMGR
jgi:hypothetical protein